MAGTVEMPADFPADDQSIEADHLLYLRVFPRPDQLAELPDGGFRPSSGSLKSEEPLSVDWSVKCGPEETRDRDTSSPFHVAAIPAGLARTCGCRVVYAPEPDNDAHAHIYGLHRKLDGTFTGALSQRQAEKMVRGGQIRIVLFNDGADYPQQH